MTDTTCHMSISLDGFVAGPDQSREHPLGKRGRELHGWHLGDERAKRPTRPPSPGSCARAAPTSWAATCSGRSAVSGRRTGAAGGGPSRRTTHRCSCSPITPASRSRWRAGRPSTSSPTASTPPTHRRVDGRRRRRGHRRRRLHRSAGARRRGRRRAHARHRPGPARVRRADLRRRRIVGLEPVEVLHSPLATHIRYRRVS